MIDCSGARLSVGQRAGVRVNWNFLDPLPCTLYPVPSTLFTMTDLREQTFRLTQFARCAG